MRPAPLKGSSPLVLVCGEDDFGVKTRARELYSQWTAEVGGMDHDILDASVSNSGEALKVLGKFRESLQTLPFFGSGKVIWLQNCNFLGDERTASSSSVTDALAELCEELKQFTWDRVRVLISAGKVDKRKTFYKTVDKLGSVESFGGWSLDDRDWALLAENFARKNLGEQKKEISEEALAELVNRVGPNSRQLASEVEKLCLYVGSRQVVELEDVQSICVRNKSARAFALGDALGDRDLPKLLRRLDEELWEVKLDPRKSEIGLLYGLIAKVRSMLLLKQMIREGWVKGGVDYQRFKAQLEKVPVDKLPADKRFNPLSLNPYVLFKALPQVRLYAEEELVEAMEALLRCNLKLVSSGLDETLVLQQTLVQIVGGAGSKGSGELRA